MLTLAWNVSTYKAQNKTHKIRVKESNEEICNKEMFLTNACFFLIIFPAISAVLAVLISGSSAGRARSVTLCKQDHNSQTSCTN